MIPAAFDYVRAETIEEALQAITDDDVKVIAGGQSLVPLMRWRLAQPDKVVDIGRIQELKAITTDGDTLVIGGGATWRQIGDAPQVKSGWPVLGVITACIGDVQVRNVGTIGGGLAHADPASDMPAALLGLGATFVARSVHGEREIAAADFFHGPFETALNFDELLVAVKVPRVSGRAAYVGFDQPASGFPLAAAFAVVDGGAASLAFTGVSDTPFHAEGSVAADADDATIEAFVASVLEGREINEDIHASKDYRRQLAAVAAKRAIREAS